MKGLSKLACVVVPVFFAAAAIAVEDGSEHKARFGRLAELAGACWTGEFPDGARDMHCWEWVIQGKFLRDSHTVRGGDGVYSGDTIYGWDQAAGTVRFWYFNSLGGVSVGTARADGERLRFDESYEDAERSASIRSFVDIPTADEYVMVSERLAGEAWEPFLSIAYRRFGTRPAALGGPWSERWDLLFNTARDGNYEIYRRDLESGEERNLTGAPDTEWVYTGGEAPIAVSRRRAGAEPGYRLYRLDPASGEMTRINDFPVADSWVGMLPEGRGLVVCAHEAGDRELFLLGPRGEVVRRLTDNDAEDCQPDVTPDGQTVVFWSNRGGSAEIWSMPLAGGEAKRLTGYPGNDAVPLHLYGGEGPPRISPDGERIAWMSIREGENWDLYTMALDGGDVRRLTDHLADDAYPAWSPDGEWIAFHSERYGSADLFVMRPDGTELTRITDHEGYEQGPVWIPRPPTD